VTLTARGVLLDIEGTTSSVSFVFDVMFPFVLRELDAWVLKHWGSADVDRVCEQMARDAGFRSSADWLPGTDAAARETMKAEVRQLMARDVKATGLKLLQGLIWESGFASGELQAEIFPDVLPALKRWTAAGLDVRIYSSGSVHAQHLFFGHTIEGNLLGYFQGHYDTQIGGKKESASYTAIAASFKLPPGEVLFVSDIVAELDAAAAAGMQTALAARPGNAPQGDSHQHLVITSFAELDIQRG
jgi:enolase-phosphatase E1